MAALTDAQDLLKYASDAHSIDQKLDGTGTEIQYGALLENSTTKGIPISGAGDFMGISKVNTDADTTGGVYDEITIDELSIAGTPLIGAKVYCATDNYDDLDTVSGTNTEVGKITRASLIAANKYSVLFKSLARR